MSMPRAATSVATRTRSAPALMRPMASSRAAWLRSPEMASASRPARCRKPVTKRTSSLVLQKTMALSGSSYSSTRSRWSGFSWAVVT